MLHNTGIEAGSTWNKFNRPHIHILILILIALACYSNTFHVPFILDDEASIQLHTPIHGLANYFAEGWPGYNFLPNRAFGYLTFALNYEFSELNVAGYHLVNLGIHICTALLIYFLISLTFSTPFMQKTPVSPNHSQLFAFVIALLFVCHPIQTQAITYIVQRLSSMTAMFYLAAIVCYLRWRLPVTSESPASSLQGLGWYLLTLLSTLLAMKTKEISLTLPVMILLYEYSFFGLPGRKQLAKMTPILLTFFLIPVTRILHVAPALEAAAGAGGGSYLSDSHLPAYNIIRMTRWDYLFTQFNVIATYLRILLFPVNQNLDYDYPINRTLLAPRPLLALFLLLAIILLAIYMFMRSRRTSELQSQSEQTVTLPFATPQLLLLASFGIFWFFITLSVESSIIVIQDVIYEHRLYLPSLGFFLALTSFGALAFGHKWGHKTFFAVVVCIAVILSIATYSRNSVWRDWITLWTDNVSKSPNKPRPHNILGIGYYYKGDFDNAMLKYREALRLKPDYIESYYNIGLLHYAKKEHNEAITTYVKILGLSAFNATQYAGIYNELGINYTELGNSKQATTSFASAVKYEPESIEYRNNYAFALSTAGYIDDAVQQFQKVLQLDPGNAYAIQALQNINSPKKTDGT